MKKQHFNVQKLKTDKYITKPKLVMTTFLISFRSNPGSYYGMGEDQFPPFEGGTGEGEKGFIPYPSFGGKG